jgi:hypothetical protein
MVYQDTPPQLIRTNTNALQPDGGTAQLRTAQETKLSVLPEVINRDAEILATFEILSSE